MQMKFYSPLTADFFPNDTEDLDDDYSEYEGIPYTGKELTGYRAGTGGRLPLLFHPAPRGHRNLPEAAG